MQRELQIDRSFADPGATEDEPGVIELLLIQRTHDQVAWHEALQRQSDVSNREFEQWLLRQTPDSRADRDFALAAVARAGSALRLLDVSLQSDREVALAAVGQQPAAMQFVEDDLRNDRDFVLAAVARSGACLAYAATEYQKDRGVVLAAVANHSMFASATNYDLADQSASGQELWSDREFVKAAVTDDGYILQFVAVELRRDREVVLAAVADLGSALAYAEELRADSEFVLEAVSHNPRAISAAAEELRTDRQFLLKAIAREPQVLLHVKGEFRSDSELRQAAGLPPLAQETSEGYCPDYPPEWEMRVGNLCKRYPDFPKRVVVQALLGTEGHFGKGANTLSRVGNLCKRYPEFPKTAVMQALIDAEGHAGKASRVLAQEVDKLMQAQ